MDEKDKADLTEIKTDVKWLVKIMSNHLEHHSKLLFWGLGIMSTLVITLLLVVITK